MQSSHIEMKCLVTLTEKYVWEVCVKCNSNTLYTNRSRLSVNIPNRSIIKI